MNEKIKSEEAINYALKSLEVGLDKKLLFHDLNHTRGVIAAAEILGKAEGIQGENYELLRTAAGYHDTGFLKQYSKNEPEGVRFAEEHLPRFGFNPEQIKVISEIIMATQLPQNPKNLLEEIICDADLYHLAGDRFFLSTELLRKELGNYGIDFTPRKWIEGNVGFLTGHRYFTKSAIKNRAEGQAKNLVEVLELLGQPVHNQS